MTLEFEEDRLIQQLIEREGGFVNHPADKGGPTKYGITLDIFLVWMMENLSPSTAKMVYKKNYLDGPKISVLPEPLIPIMFDSAVHHGPKRAIKWMQASLRVTEDGRIGPQTTKAIRHANLKALINDIHRQRVKFLHKIVKKDPSQIAFLAGWLRRVNDFEVK